ncbi:hypothetical protein HX744_26590 [Pseudonocardia sp. ICBG1122]|nr:hypothetical protein [Pseudonocardia pini]
MRRQLRADDGRDPEPSAGIIDETARHADITTEFGVPVHSCDTDAPW